LPTDGDESDNCWTSGEAFGMKYSSLGDWKNWLYE